MRKRETEREAGRRENRRKGKEREGGRRKGGREAEDIRSHTDESKVVRSTKTLYCA